MKNKNKKEVVFFTEREDGIFLPYLLKSSSGEIERWLWTSEKLTAEEFANKYKDFKQKPMD